MAFGGSLQDFGISEILQMIGNEKKTGSLALKRKGERLSICFEHGDVVWADFHGEKFESIILKILKKRGRISEEDYSELHSIFRKRLQKLSSALLDLKFLPIEEIQSVSKFCLLEKLYPVFCWSEGEYVFTQNLPRDIGDRKLLLPIKTQLLVMEGLVQFDEWNRIKKVIPSSDVVFKKVAGKEKILFLNPKAEDDDIFDDEMDFSDLCDDDSSEEKISYPDNAVFVTDTEMAVFSIINGYYSIDSIIQLGEISTFDVSKAAMELLAVGVIEKIVKKNRKKKKENNSIKDLTYSLSFLLFLIVSLFYLSAFLGNQIGGIIMPTASFKKEVNRMQTSLETHKKEKISFAIEVYRLRNGGFPKKLHILIKSGLLKEEELLGSNAYSYKISENDFSIDRISYTELKPKEHPTEVKASPKKKFFQQNF